MACLEQLVDGGEDGSPGKEERKRNKAVDAVRIMKEV